jgi:thiamine transporter ThiT
MMKEFRTKTRTLLIALFTIFGVALALWVLYLGNFAYFCKWHFEDSEARFLVLGDPQMEGDSRILRQGIYGKIDLMYNDAYFKHIVATIMKYLSPTQVFVLGDLFSSQYISDNEFAQRVARYNYIFEGVNVPLYNITGNHDLGYASEVTPYRIQRFESAFGKVNDAVIIADHVVGIVNSVNIDASAEKELRRKTWDHMNNLSETSQNMNMPLIMMTHIPLHKESYGSENFKNLYAREKRLELCTDRSYTATNSNGHVEVQNMLEPSSSRAILDRFKPAFIFNGHDHDGCIYRHNENTVEYTIRSMMGEFGGYAGLFEIRRNPPTDPQPFSYYYTPCPFVSTTMTTITFVVVIVYIFALTSAALFYSSLPKKQDGFSYEAEYAARYVKEFHDYVKAKSA